MARLPTCATVMAFVCIVYASCPAARADEVFSDQTSAKRQAVTEPALRGAAGWWAKARGAAIKVEPAYEARPLLCDIARAQADSGDQDGARHTLAVVRQSIDDGDPPGRQHWRWSGLRALAETHIAIGDLAGAEATINEYGQASGQERGHAELTALLGEAHAKAGHRERARALFKTVNRTIDPDWPRGSVRGVLGPYEKILLAEVRAGQADLATEVVTQFPSGFRRTAGLCRIAGQQADAGDPDGALATYKLARAEDAPELGTFDFEYPLRAIARVYAEKGEFAKAEATIALMRDGPQRDIACIHIAVAHAEAGRIEQAREATAWITEPKHRWSPLVQIARALVARREESDARQAIKELLKLAADSETPGERAQCFRESAAIQVSMGDIEGARKSLDTARQAAGAITTDPNHVACALREICADQAEMGDLASAEATARRIDNDYQASQAYRHIAAAQLKAKDIAAAKRTAGRITQRGEMAKACEAIARGQAEAGELGALSDWIDSLERPDWQARACIGAATALARAARETPAPAP